MFTSPPDFESPADADGDNVYEVTVSAADGHGEAETLALRVRVTDAANESPPAIESVTLSSTPSIDADGDGRPDTYGRDEHVEVTVTWTADVTWDVSSGASDMRVRLDVGGRTRVAHLVRGGAERGTARSLAFRYRVERGHRDGDGIFPKPARNGNLVHGPGGATLRDALDRNASRAHAGLAPDAGHRVDGFRTPPPPNRAPAFPAEPPGTPATVYVVAENNAAGAPVATIAATDPDGDALTYALDSASDAVFDIDAGGAITVTAANAFDHETTAEYVITVSVHDGRDAAGAADATVDATTRVTVVVADLEEPPAFPANAPTTLTVAENNAAGAPVGRVAATDPDGDALTYALDSASDAVFDIDAGGAITVTAANALDYETTARYAVTVSVHDGKDAAGAADATVDATHRVTVAVTDVAEQTLGVADAAGPEGSTLSFAVGLSAPSPATVTVAYATADGTATAGADYQAASGTLTFAPGEVAKTVAVAALTDTAAEGDETFTLVLSSVSGALLGDREATGTVENVAPPLTASFHGVPAEHDGKKRFRFELRFSENFPGRFNYRVLRDRALQVTNGRVIRAKRAAPGQNQRWLIEIRPTSAADVVVTLPATADCAAPAAVCTDSGRMLANASTARVPGPAALSVADARATEGADEAVAFAVTLSRAAAGVVTVDYATADGTATAGTDYTASRGTLAFAPGERAKTIAVAVLDDAHDEGEETLTLTLSNASGATIADGAATGTIANADPLLNAWLARFGRSAASQTVAAVSGRLALPPGSGSRVTLGGRQLSLSGQAEADGDVPADGAAVLAEADAVWRSRDGTRTEPGTVRSLRGRELLLGTSFHLAADGSGGGRLAGWGRAGAERFRNTDGGLPVEGEVVTGVFGADWERADWLAGVALTYSVGLGEMRPRGQELRFDYDLESEVMAVNPYVRLRLSERLTAWGLAGYGAGTLELTQTPKAGGSGTLPASGQTYETDLGMMLGAAGARGELLAPAATGGLSLALKGDAFWVRSTSEALAVEGLGNLAEAEADASRLRLTLEGSRTFTLAGGGTLTPTVEAGVRHDGGDAETGAGLELGGGLRYEDPSAGVSMDLRARTLVAHAASGYREWGLAGAVRIAPGADGRGFALTLAPAWGADAGSAERLWSVRDAHALVPSRETDPSARLDAEVGYGFVAPTLAGTVRPYAGLALAAGDAETWRVGARWQLTPAAMLGVEGERRGAGGDRARPTRRVMSATPRGGRGRGG
ncbi:MAG: hypothetical protein F4Y03_15515, partial [Alphaproteobacteria bacterium]|nr:hypothetical protein [Alphaproteobacteria bacterium]